MDKKIETENFENNFKKLINYYKNDKISALNFVLKTGENKLKIIILNHKEYGLYGKYLNNLFDYIDDDEFKKKLIFGFKKYKLNWYNIDKIASTIIDNSIIIELVKNADIIGFDGLEIKVLSKYIKDKKEIKKIIKNYKKDNVDRKVLRELLCVLDDEKFKKKTIKHHKEYGFTKSDIVQIIETFSYELMQDFICNHEKYKFNDDEISSIVNDLLLVGYDCKGNNISQKKVRIRKINM